MTVRALDHVNIRTADVPATMAFFRDVLGLRADIAPGAASLDQGCWMYDPANRPIIHIGAATATYPSDGERPFTSAQGSGAVHHVALDCDDFDAMSARIEAAGRTYWTNDVPQIGLKQLFVAEANDILLELNFRID